MTTFDRPAPPPMVPFGTVFRLVFAASARELLRRRRLVFLALACSLPLLLSLMWSLWGTEHFSADKFFTNLVSSLYLSALVYVVGLAFGVPTVHDEVEGRTLTYLLTRPISRIAVYAGRLAAVQLLAGSLLALSLVVCFGILVVGDPSALSVDFLKTYVNHVWVLLLATVVLTGLFSIFGTLFRRPLVWGIVYAFAWEGTVSKIPGQLQVWTLDFHFRNLMLRDADVQNDLLDVFRQLLSDQTDIAWWVSLIVLLVALVVFSWVGGWIFSQKEYVIN